VSIFNLVWFLKEGDKLPGECDCMNLWIGERPRPNLGDSIDLTWRFLGLFPPIGSWFLSSSWLLLESFLPVVDYNFDFSSMYLS